MSLAGFQWPMLALATGTRPKVSDHFDRRGANGHRIHLGVDVMYPRVPKGPAAPPELSPGHRFPTMAVPIVAVGPARVHSVDRLDRHGIVVMLDHGNVAGEGPRVSVYRHLATCAVEKGQRVPSGAFLGFGGRDPSQGAAALNHLHFEWWDTGRPRAPGGNMRQAFAINPADLLSRVKVKRSDGAMLPPDLSSLGTGGEDSGEGDASGAVAEVLLDLAFVPGGV